ncbi:hypothetical protein MTR_8g044960 [Medicago truncatula]|uniref:Uncharacterized protein n=1 Tax=Medicago truncatula TaxID=3880 RepID=G7L7P4_MEDTR|nr:hypothetical protein MTR_8g044960 [Medicago truncatula]
MPSSILYTLSLPIHLQILEEKRKRSESTNSSPETQDMSQISTLTEISTLTLAHTPIYSISARKRKRFMIEEQVRRLSEIRSTRFSRISGNNPCLKTTLSTVANSNYTKTCVNEENRKLKQFEQNQLDDTIILSPIVGSIEEVEGSLGQYFRCSENIKEIDEKGMVAARHFDAKHFRIEVDMWLGFEDAKKVDYIKSLVSADAQQLLLTRGC